VAPFEVDWFVGRIRQKEMTKEKSKTLYEKRGNKFVPVGKDRFILPYGVGDYLVRVRRNGHTVRWYKKKLNVDYAKLEVALDEAAESLAHAIVLYSQPTPRVTRLTPRERKALEEYMRISRRSTLMLTTKSALEIARLSVSIIRGRLKADDSPLRPEGCLEVYAEKGAGM
jgi:hypothetical protein